MKRKTLVSLAYLLSYIADPDKEATTTRPSNGQLRKEAARLYSEIGKELNERDKS